MSSIIAASMASVPLSTRHHRTNPAGAAIFELFQAGEFEAAALRFGHGLEIDPTSGLAHFYLAETYARQEKKALAGAHYQRTIDFAPDSKEAAIARTRIGK